LGFTTIETANRFYTGEIDVFIRPEAFCIVSTDKKGNNLFDATVLKHVYLGNYSIIIAEASGKNIRLEFDENFDTRPGDTIRLQLDQSKIHIFQTGKTNENNLF
jgi:ABC-type Fe3+/spermidine/putrescine transport system ATPase subunit